MGGEIKGARFDKVVFEIGRGLLFGGLAATIFRQDIHAFYPISALVLGFLLLIYYIRKEEKS